MIREMSADGGGTGAVAPVPREGELPRAVEPPPNFPRIIQGGMGVAISNWQLARAVSSAGQLGVVSGVGLCLLLSRRLQDGDPGGPYRRAL